MFITLWHFSTNLCMCVCVHEQQFILIIFPTYGALWEGSPFHTDPWPKCLWSLEFRAVTLAPWPADLWSGFLGFDSLCPVPPDFVTWWSHLLLLLGWEPPLILLCITFIISWSVGTNELRAGTELLPLPFSSPYRQGVIGVSAQKLLPLGCWLNCINKRGFGGWFWFTEYSDKL